MMARWHRRRFGRLGDEEKKGYPSERVLGILLWPAQLLRSMQRLSHPVFKRMLDMCVGKGIFWSLAAVLLAGSATAASRPVDEFTVTVRVLDQGDEEEIRVDCAMVSKGRKVNMLSGGEVAGSENAPPLEFGTRITGHIANSKGETRSVALKIEFSRLFDGGENSIPVVRGEMLALRADLKPGETTRISCGGNRSCELRLDRLEK
jgi:hypothetical protein